MKKVNSPNCPFCANNEQATLHHFVTRPVAISFWSDFIQWYHQICKKKTRPHKKRNHVRCTKGFYISFNREPSYFSLVNISFINAPLTSQDTSFFFRGLYCPGAREDRA